MIKPPYEPGNLRHEVWLLKADVFSNPSLVLIGSSCTNNAPGQRRVLETRGVLETAPPVQGRMLLWRGVSKHRIVALQAGSIDDKGVLEQPDLNAAEAVGAEGEDAA